MSMSGEWQPDTYDQAWTRLEAEGRNPHGEADFVMSLGPSAVLDGGCGTGRVAIELSRRGIDVVGADVDAGMLAEARRKAPALSWLEADLATVETGRRFDVIVLAGNVMIFVVPGTEAAVVANMARHLGAGGALVAGFQLRPGGYDLNHYDADAAAAGLRLDERWATWDREPWRAGGDYAVSVHRPER